MGNTHVFYHRLPAVATSCLATFGLALAVIAGTSCSFLDVTSDNGHLLEFAEDDGITIEISSTSLGILCLNKYYDIEGDLMRQLSKIFLFSAVGLGGFATALSWALATILPPSDCNWKLLSVLTAIVAVVQVPIFLIFEAEPCTQEKCSISYGVYFLIVSTILWIVVTIVTQCIDPPSWAIELNGWRVQKGTSQTRQSGIPGWMEQRKWPNLGLAATAESGSHDDEKEKALADLMENGSYYADSSHLLLKVEHGRLPGDDQKSVTTFGDLEDDVRMAEAERGDPLLGTMICSEDEMEPDLLQVGTPTTMIICGLASEPEQYYSDPAAFQNEDYELFENEESIGVGNAKAKRVSSIRSLTALVKLGKSRRYNGTNNFYHSMSSDNEDALSSSVRSQIPREIIQSGHICEIVMPSTNIDPDDKKAQEDLLQHWKTIHNDSDPEIFLPTTDEISSCEKEPPPLLLTSDDNNSTISSIGQKPEYEDGSTLSGSSIDDSLDHEGHESKNSIIDEVRRRKKQIRKQNRKNFSGAHSVCSQTSLLDLTIAEETDFQLREFDGSADEKSDRRNLHDTYIIARTKSAPGAFSDQERIQAESGSSHPLPKTSSATKSLVDGTPPRDDANRRSLQRRMSNDDKKVRRHSPSADIPRRSRSVSLPRESKRTDHNVVTPEKKIYSSTLLDMPTYRSERILKAGIQAHCIAVVSDESASSDEDNSVGERSSRTSVSRLARQARMDRLTSDSKQRSRTLDPPHSRLPSSKQASDIINIIDFDPSLNIVWKSRRDGVEYGPDEASL